MIFFTSSQVEYLHIGHDGSGPGAGWFLDGVDVDIPSRGELYTFAAHRWLASDEEDGELQVELYPTDVKKTKARKLINPEGVWFDDIVLELGFGNLT